MALGARQLAQDALQRLACTMAVARLADPAHLAILGAHHDEPYFGTAIAAKHAAVMGFASSRHVAHVGALPGYVGGGTHGAP
jgi:hypothetical protein